MGNDMRTILYDISNNTIISQVFTGGYKVDGMNATLPPDIVELSVIDNGTPQHNSITHRVVSEWLVELEASEYLREYTIIELTDYEIAIKDWQHTSFAKRIIAPKQLVLEPIGISMYGWFQINNLPVEPKGSIVYLYCNEVLPEHQQVIDMLQGLIIVQDRPQP